MIAHLLEAINFNVETATPNEALQAMRLLTDAEKLTEEDVELINVIAKAAQPAGSFPSNAMIDKLENLKLVVNFRTEIESSMYAITHRGWTMRCLFKAYDDHRINFSKISVSDIEYVKNNFASWFRTQRQKFRLSEEEVSKLLDVPQANIPRYENGSLIPGHGDTLLIIEKFIKLHAETLFVEGDLKTDLEVLADRLLKEEGLIVYTRAADNPPTVDRMSPLFTKGNHEGV